MNPRFRPRPVLFALGITIAASGLPAKADLPEPWDPQQAAGWSLERRLERLRLLREQMLKASPAERSAYRESLQRKLAQMDPQARKALHDQMHAEWKKLSKEQKESLKQERKAMMAAFTRAERREIREELQKRKSAPAAQ